MWSAVHHPAEEYIHDVGLQSAVGRHDGDEFFIGLVGIHDGVLLNDLQEVTAFVSWDDVIGNIVTSGEDLFVGGHQVVIVFLASAVTGDTLAFDDGLDVNIIGWDFSRYEWRE